jgi:hypothetical protein
MALVYRGSCPKGDTAMNKSLPEGVEGLVERLRIGQAYSDEYGEDMIRAANKLEALQAENDRLRSLLTSEEGVGLDG